MTSDQDDLIKRIEGIIAGAKTSQDCVKVFEYPPQWLLKLPEGIEKIESTIRQGVKLARSPKDILCVYTAINDIGDAVTEFRQNPFLMEHFETMFIREAVAQNISFPYKKDMIWLTRYDDEKAWNAARSLMFISMFIEDLKAEHEGLPDGNLVKRVVMEACQER